VSGAATPIQAEANRLLHGGLLTLLGRGREVHVVGSYALGLMTWRDLDIHLVREARDVPEFFRLGGDIAALLKPHRMHFRDESLVRTPGLPPGLYWGVYLGDERAGAWKIDIWETDREGFEPVRRFAADLAARLDDDSRAAIVAIKTACWQHPEYRRTFTSSDVYEAVLERGVRDVGAFWNYIRDTKGVADALRAPARRGG
jgi:hypothetical protein